MRDKHDGRIEKTKTGKYKCTIRIKYGGKLRYISSTQDTAAKAKKAAQEKLKQFGISKSSEIDVKAERKKTIKQSFNDYVDANKGHWSPTTRKVRLDFYNLMILDHIGEIQVKDINSSIINNCIKKWPTNYCNDNIKKSYNFLREYIYFLVDNGVIPDIRSSVIQKPASIKESKKSSEIIDNFPLILSEDEYTSLRSFYDKQFTKKASKTDRYHTAMFLLMLLTGMRGQELRALSVKDLDINKHSINITKAVGNIREDESEEDLQNRNKLKKRDGKAVSIIKATKNDKSRRKIGVNKQIEGLFLSLVQDRPNQQNDLLIQNSLGEILEKRSFEKMFDKILRKAGIEKYERTPHCLRHTFISWAIGQKESSPLKGKEPLFVSAYVGHNSLRTTMDIYSHVNADELLDVEYIDNKYLI